MDGNKTMPLNCLWQSKAPYWHHCWYGANPLAVVLIYYETKFNDSYDAAKLRHGCLKSWDSFRFYHFLEKNIDLYG